jgi:predicted Fe-Mo cluster-binding NifX family protein
MTDRVRLAVPTVGEGGLESERSAHFGHCDTFTLLEIDGTAIVDVRVIENPPHAEGGCLASVKLLASHGVDSILVAGMGARPLRGFNDAGMSVYFENVTPRVADAVELFVANEVALMEERSACGGHSHDHGGHAHGSSCH